MADVKQSEVAMSTSRNQLYTLNPEKRKKKKNTMSEKHVKSDANSFNSLDVYYSR